MARQSNSAEEIVEEVLQKLTSEKVIIGYERNRSSDWLDEKGVDFLIFKESGWALALQVKTKSPGTTFEDKMREHKRKHPLVKHLICIAVHRLESEKEQLYRDVEKELRQMLKTPL